MVLRRDDRGVLAIGQASHAWISGQLARAWGNEQFGFLDPYEEVSLAAEQHDVGMAAWDLAPSRNPDTGLPHSFVEMPIAVHMKLWREGPRRLLTQSRYAALLVAMHGRRLYEKRDLCRLEPDEAELVRRFLTESRDFQANLQTSLGAGDEQVRRNSDLIWTWDFLSLALCLDWAPCTAADVPSLDGPVDLELRADGTLQPWPFGPPALTVRAEGRRLPSRYDSDEELTAALASARWEMIAFELRRA
jgi:Protein of unknown function (DUF3891)